MEYHELEEKFIDLKSDYSCLEAENESLQAEIKTIEGSYFILGASLKN